MSSWEIVRGAIEGMVPDQRVLSDLWSSLEDDYGDPPSDVSCIRVPNDEAPLVIPRDSPLTVVMTTCTVGKQTMPFTAFHVLVAIGDVERRPNSNIVKAGICFATLFYSVGGSLITYDLHEEFR